MNKTMKALTLLPLVVPAVASAHTGGLSSQASSQFLAGVFHAFTGLDHVLGAIMGGACIAMALHKANQSVARALPAALVAVITFIASAIFGSAMPASLATVAEWAVLASLVIMMAAIATGLKSRGQPLALASMLVTALACCHGLTHGAALPTSQLADVAVFATGASAILIAFAGASAVSLKRILARFKLAKY